MKKIRWSHRNLHRICKFSLFRLLILNWWIFFHFHFNSVRNIDMNVILLEVIVKKGVPFILNKIVLLLLIFKLDFVTCCVLYQFIMKFLHQLLKIMFDSVELSDLFVKFLWRMLNLVKLWLLKSFLEVIWHCNIRRDYSRPICVFFPLRRMLLF